MPPRHRRAGPGRARRWRARLGRGPQPVGRRRASIPRPPPRHRPPCWEASAAVCSASAVLPIPGSPTRWTTRCAPRRAAVITVAIAASSRARPTSTSGSSCGATPGTPPGRSTTTRSSPSAVGCQPGTMSGSPGEACRRPAHPGSRPRTGLDVASHGARVGAHPGHEQPQPEGVRSGPRPGAPPSPLPVLRSPTAVRPSLPGRIRRRNGRQGRSKQTTPQATCGAGYGSGGDEEADAEGQQPQRPADVGQRHQRAGELPALGLEWSDELQ